MLAARPAAVPRRCGTTSRRRTRCGPSVSCSGLGPEMAGSGSDFSVMASWLRLLILGTLVIFLHEETIHVSKLILLLCVLT